MRGRKHRYPLLSTAGALVLGILVMVAEPVAGQQPPPPPPPSFPAPPRSPSQPSFPSAPTTTRRSSTPNAGNQSTPVASATTTAPAAGAAPETINQTTATPSTLGPLEGGDRQVQRRRGGIPIWVMVPGLLALMAGLAALGVFLNRRFRPQRPSDMMRA